jgi:hypothetical protein
MGKEELKNREKFIAEYEYFFITKNDLAILRNN